MNKQSGSAHVIVIIVLAAALIGAIGFLFWQNIINKSPVAATVSQYADCVKSEGSVLQETYPETCVTKAGQRFVNPDQKANAVTPKKYCTPIEKLCFDYPNDWSVASEKVNADTDGVAERFVISDQTGKSWLRLETGMGGLGGTCSNEDKSYTNILKTHTTSVKGSYLVNDTAKDYMVDTAYALSWITYSGTNKNWTMDMELNNSKTAQAVGKVDPCDIGLGVINGKNIKAGGSATAGAVAFKYYKGNDINVTYATEASATAALSAPEAAKAYDILQSARYE
ncbi:MAG: hypothetical protein JWN75_522 [Candidatus Saccharibacteria bacterium]|nr:hypothetical protein [Candidatus Saccharibacteria bacterium]